MDADSMGSLKILILHNIMFSHYKAKVFSELAKLQETNKINIFVVQIATTEKQRPILGEIDYSIHRYPYKLLFDLPLEKVPWYKHIYAIVQVLVDYEYDVIVIPGYIYLFCWAAMAISIIRGKKLILAFDSTEMDNVRKPWKENVKKFFIRRFSSYLCYGTKSKSYLIKLGANHRNIFIRCQATDNQTIFDEYCNSQNNRACNLSKMGLPNMNFIYVGRLIKEKNIITLLAAYGAFKYNNPYGNDWGLIIVGDGPEREMLTGWVADNDIKDVCFVGGKTWKEVPKYYALSDVFVLPSISEAWGLVVNEAMTCGLPVIVSNKCGAVPDLVHDNENGFTFDPLNIKQLEGLLSYFANNKDFVKKMGKQSRDIISHYTPENAAMQMVKGILS